MQIKANGLTLEVEVSGPADGEPILLIMGLGMQLTAWPDALLQALAGRGFRTIVFDNRDIGLSTHFDAWGRPNLGIASIRLAFGMRIRTPYLLADMARDAMGVLDALQLDRVHVLGVSMGGMIAQHLAVDAPARVKNLTLMMTTSGARHLPGPTLRARRALLSRPGARNIDGLVEHSMRVLRAIGSTAYPNDDATLRARLERSIRRSYHPQGMARHLVAVAASGDRSPLLSRITHPTLVIHGRDDPLVPVACGIDLANQIPGARLELIDGMGHDLPPGLVPRLAELVISHCAQRAR